MLKPEAESVEPQKYDWFFNRRAYAAVFMSGLSLLAGAAGTARANQVQQKSLAQCNRYPLPSKSNNHEREVCTAYMFNSEQVALQGFYKFGNNRIKFTADPSREHFETRYFEQPQVEIEQRVDSWPQTDSLFGNKVDQNADLYGQNPVVSNLKADRALLRTKEHWDVYGDDGNSLYHEPEHVRDITMCRGKLPGIQHLLHEWFVVKYSRDPNFNCIAYDKSHNIKP